MREELCVPIINIIVLRVSDTTTNGREQADHGRASPMTRNVEHSVGLEQRCIVPVALVDLLQMSDKARGKNWSQPGPMIRILQRISELHVRSAEDCVDLHVRGSAGDLSGGSVRTSAETSIQSEKPTTAATIFTRDSAAMTLWWGLCHQISIPYHSLLSVEYEQKIEGSWNNPPGLPWH